MALARNMASSNRRRPRRPGEDMPVSSTDDLSVIQAVRECVREADDARRGRLKRNKINVDASMGIQDFSYKVEGQSQEFLPKVSLSLEQLSAFVKKALTQFGSYYNFTFSEQVKANIPLIDEHVKDIVDYYLTNLPDGKNSSTTFQIRMGDAVKVGALESLIIFKVYGSMHKERTFHIEFGDEKGKIDDQQEDLPDQEQETINLTYSLRVSDAERWRLHVDLIKPEDYYPDPSGEGLYEVHRVERDLSYVLEKAEQGIYDKQAVALLQVSVRRKEEERRRAYRVGQDESNPPSFRKKVVLDEFWGTLLDSNGKIVKRNCVCTIANDQYLIRKPEDNPNWHGESPFVVFPLVRVPWSVWHKALYDPASSLNLTLNEIFNLILDGGLASVWGIKQLRAGMLENPEVVSNGIPQGKTLVIKDDVPEGMKVLEQVTEGTVPQDALAVMQLVNSEFLSSVLSSELKLGGFPDRKVLATEITQLEGSQSVTLDSICGDMEQLGIDKVLSKAWLCILQNMDVIDEDELQNQIGGIASLWLAQTSPAVRFAALAKHGSFKATGLTAIITKSKDFQKMAALLQLSQSNPILLQAFIRRFSGDKMLVAAMKMLNLNPEELEKDESELANIGMEMKLALAMGAGRGGTTGANASGQGALPGGSDVQAEIGQAGNPISGLSAS